MQKIIEMHAKSQQVIHRESLIAFQTHFKEQQKVSQRMGLRKHEGMNQYLPANHLLSFAYFSLRHTDGLPGRA